MAKPENRSCTECGAAPNEDGVLHGECVRYEAGRKVWLVGPDELLCDRCAAHRGFRSLAEIHAEMEAAQ